MHKLSENATVAYQHSLKYREAANLLFMEQSKGFLCQMDKASNIGQKMSFVLCRPQMHHHHTSPFTILKDQQESTYVLNNDLSLISK